MYRAGMKHILSFTLMVIVLNLGALAAHAQTVSVVYNFGAQVGDPVQPFYAGVIAQGQDGNLYSGSAFGGSLNGGALYQITPSGAETEPYAFDIFGSGPYGGLTLGTDGNFYGTTYASNPGYGMVFKWTSTLGANGLDTLYTFTDGTDGAEPWAPPIEGADGNFYGTTCPQGFSTGYGSIYKITPTGTFTPLHDFDSTDGYCPYDPLVQGTEGNFYGTTFFGGTNCTSGVSCGVVFKITPTGTFTVLHNFCAQTIGSYCADGEGPVGPLVQGSDGNFYGTTQAGGANNFGVVFRITPAGKFKVLHSMTTTGGYVTTAGLVQATDGNFYGANSGGGKHGDGTIFKITPQGAFTKLYDFTGTTGETPYTTPMQHTNGLLYGTTQLGGSGSMAVGCGIGECGVFYSVNIGAAPFVAFVGQPVGKVGRTVEILGQGLTGTTNVSFGAASASFTVVSDTYLRAIVPSGATTAAVTVTTPGGILTSNKAFRVTP